MAVLTNPERASLFQHIMRNLRDFLAPGEDATALKAEYQALISDLDDWLDSQGTEANQAIRAGIRSKFTTAEKFRVLALIAAKRGGLTKVGG